MQEHLGSSAGQINWDEWERQKEGTTPSNSEGFQVPLRQTAVSLVDDREQKRVIGMDVAVTPDRCEGQLP